MVGDAPVPEIKRQPPYLVANISGLNRLEWGVGALATCRNSDLARTFT